MTYLTYKEFCEELDKIDSIEKEEGPTYAWMYIIIKNNKMSLSVACITGCDERREDGDKTYYIYGEHSSVFQCSLMKNVFFLLHRNTTFLYISSSSIVGFSTSLNSGELNPIFIFN